MYMKDVALESHIALSALPQKPVCGESFAVFLLQGDRVIGAYGDSPRVEPGAICEALLLPREEWSEYLAFLREPTADFMALYSPARKSVILICPLHGEDGTAVVVQPFVSVKSLVRVMRHAFAKHVCCSHALQAMVEGQLRQEDEHTFVYLQSLLTSLRKMSYGSGHAMSVGTRQELSRLLCARVEAVSDFLGIAIPQQWEIGILPLPLPFEGSFHAHAALWMLLCIAVGLLRCYSTEEQAKLRLTMDRELLLPMLRLPTGNRRAIPAEWTEAADFAKRHHMFFDVRRMGGHVLVRLCPMTESGRSSSLYAMRSIPAWVEQWRRQAPDGWWRSWE